MSRPREIAGFADAVIVGSAFVSAAERGGPDAVRELAAELAAGIGRAATERTTAARQASPA